MRRVISLSALVSGLLASPGLAVRGVEATVPDADSTAAGLVGASVPESGKAGALGAAFSGGVPTPAQLQARLAEMVESDPEDVGGMRELQRRVNEGMRAYLAGMLATGGPVMQAIEAPPASAVIPAADLQMFPPQPMEKGTFLGITTSRVSATLREQLKLPWGMGLVVDFVAKDSPAQAAGLQPHDILQKLDDQWLVNREQLAVLVRSKKPGDEVTLTVIRGGKPLQLKAKLVQREVPVLEDEALGDLFAPLGSWPDGDTFLLGNGKGTSGGWHGQRIRVVQNGDGTVSGTLDDDEGEIELSRNKEGKVTLVAKDPSGKEIYRGPFTTAQDKAQAPAEIARRAESIKLGEDPAAIRIQVNNGQVEVHSGGSTIRASHLTFTRSDDAQRIVLEVGPDGESVVATDVKTGKLLYEGPANTAEDLKKMPPDVAQKVRGMEAKVELEK